MTKSKKSKRVVAKKAAKTPPTPVQEGLQVTWWLNGNIKRSQIEYLHIAERLTLVREKSLYSALHHPDMESYARERLHLGKTSLYKYLLVYDWVKRSHPEWLQPKPKGVIPVLSDTVNLMWIDEQLKKKNLTPETRSELEALQADGLAGESVKKQVVVIQKRSHPVKGSLKSFLSKLRLLRKHGSELANMPAEVVGFLDSAIEVLKNDENLRLAGMDFIDAGRSDAKWSQILPA